jgi:hypothetical protein
MGKAVVILATIALMGCGGPAEPSLNTPQGYRQGTILRAERISAIVNSANTSCMTGSVSECQQALHDQESLYNQQPELAPLGGRPPACNHLASNYFFLVASAQDYFAKVKTSVAQHDQIATRQAAQERMVSFNQSWNAFNETVQVDSCR